MGCEVQNRECSSQRAHRYDPGTWTTVRGLPEGVWGLGVRAQRGKKLGQL